MKCERRRNRNGYVVGTRRKSRVDDANAVKNKAKQCCCKLKKIRAKEVSTLSKMKLNNNVANKSKTEQQMPML
jgi:hypothetical protein